MRKRKVVERIYGMKYSWKGHKDTNSHKYRLKRSGQAQLHHHEPNCLSKRLVCCLKVKVTVKDHVKIWLFDMPTELLIHLQLNLVWWHTIIGWFVLWKDLIALLCSRSRSQERFRIPVTVHLDSIPSTAFVTKHGMVMHRHGTEWVSCRKIGLLSQGQCHSEGSYNQIWLFSHSGGS